MDTSVTKMNAADNTQLLEEKKVVYSSNNHCIPGEPDTYRPSAGMLHY